MNTPDQNPKTTQGWAESSVPPSRPPLRPELTVAQKEFNERQHSMKVDELLRDSRAPKRHLQLHLNTNQPGVEWDEVFGNLIGLYGKTFEAKSGMLVGICGVRGNGKTQLAVELMKHVISLERSAHYMTAIGFFQLLKESYRKDSEESERSIINDLRKFKLLVIDEIGKRGSTDWENNQLFELINHRYNDLTATVLIDNRTKAEFVETLGPSLASRMQETGGIIEANWESFRK